MEKLIAKIVSMKRLVASFFEIQILRLFTTLAILTIVFVLVLKFVQQTSQQASPAGDKIKPTEATLVNK